MQRVTICLLMRITKQITYDPEGLFEPMVPHKITAIIKANQLLFHVKNDQVEKLCTWQLDENKCLDR